MFCEYVSKLLYSCRVLYTYSMAYGKHIARATNMIPCAHVAVDRVLDRLTQQLRANEAAAT